MRTLFNKPIRKGITDEFYPDKFTLEEFEEEILGSFNAYAKNMVKIKAAEPKFIEEWFEQYLAWLDIEQEPEK